MTSIEGRIKRRIRVDYRADPSAVALRLPPPFEVQDSRKPAGAP